MSGMATRVHSYDLRAGRSNGFADGVLVPAGRRVYDMPDRFKGRGKKGGAMAALLRLIGVMIALEVLFYVLISVYLRSLRRESLEGDWDARHPEQAGDSPRRRAFVERAMVGFDKTLRARLVGLVFVLPTIAVAAIIYYVNYY